MPSYEKELTVKKEEYVQPSGDPVDTRMKGKTSSSHRPGLHLFYASVLATTEAAPPENLLNCKNGRTFSYLQKRIGGRE
ncbi:hypothetical protein NPIL_210641 [Nephila pilipes]|uniref:Uncharacterized protein n=1 Tax=Nephila pilipes TaxID=299642 RepID=A0A8X6QHQ5_NEPPI|nr:hypothetical protein NPIL_210641 [Nephila pilipes]